MNKKDLIEAVAAELGQKKVDVEKSLNAILEGIEAGLKTDREVSLYGFGTFAAVLQKGKSGIVPGTDKMYTTQDKMVPKFKAAKGLKDSIATL